MIALAAAVGNEEGSATITAAGIAGAVVMVTLVMISIATTTIDTHRAQVAAELAAVSAAAVRYHGGDACQVAAQVVARNKAQITDCQVDGSDVIVQTTVRISTATAKAGPI